MSIQCPICKKVFEDKDLSASLNSTITLNELVKVRGTVLCDCGTEITYSQYFAPSEDPPEIECISNEQGDHDNYMFVLQVQECQGGRWQNPL